MKLISIVLCLLVVILAMPVRAVASGPVVTGALLRGDADHDGEVTAADARQVLRASVGLEQTDPASLSCSDADLSLDLTPADARLILRFVVGLEELPDPEGGFSIDAIPEYSGLAYAIVNLNVPYFEPDEITSEPYEYYSDLDELGRCGPACACLGDELMPKGERGAIGSVYPSGWDLAAYDFIPERYLFNRCHLIAWSLTGENANSRNLITGTRYMNISGMQSFETELAARVRKGENILYRVTPVFVGDELVARGVLMEALSVSGDCFCVFCYNVQPGVEIDYATGKSHREGSDPGAPSEEEITYVVNISSGRIHLPDCPYAESIDPSNRLEYTGALRRLLDAGYSPCGVCLS